MTPARADGPVPSRVSVRAYNVGFGDGLLVSFSYPRELDDGRAERHVLIDFGSTRWPKGHQGGWGAIADSIAERTGGRLDVLVITHRHKDHLSGFADDEAADAIAKLAPRLVVRPWTEHPEAASDATAPRRLGEDSRRFAAGLDSAQAFAAAVSERIPDDVRGLRGDLRGFAAAEVPNREAIERIDALARSAERGARYLHVGQRSGIESLLPGVRATVLGPPTPEQWPEVTGQREEDPEEFWIGRRSRLERMLEDVARPPEARAATAAGRVPDPGPGRWLVQRMIDHQAHSLLRIVRALDDALNNTSVILLFEAGERRLLFPGDAQIENWSYCLKSPRARRLRAALPDVDLYKVGHHGSRNATPRSLVKLWRPGARKVTSVLSTLPGVHGESEATAVPRDALTRALAQYGRLHRTDELPPGQLYVELTASTSNRRPFAVAGR